MATLLLPWPDRALSPNARKGWRGKLSPKSAARGEAFLLAKSAGWRLEHGDYELELIFYPPDRRHRDLDNLFASLKPAIDGVCQAAGVDDRCIRHVHLSWGEVVEHGVVEMRMRCL